MEQLSKRSNSWDSPRRSNDRVSTYKRSDRRLDCVLCTADVVQSTDRCGHLPFDYLPSSQWPSSYVCGHRSSQDPGRMLSALPAIEFRDVRSNHRASVTKYIEAKHAYLEQHNVYDRMQHLLESTEPDHSSMEAIDRDLSLIHI